MVKQLRGSLVRPTDNQEKFVQEIIKGKSQREAYRTAYPNCRASDEVVDVKASQLFATDKVKLRYNELHGKLMEAAEKETIMSAIEVLEELSVIGRSSIDDFLKVCDKKVVTSYAKDNDGNVDYNRPQTATIRTVEVFETIDIDKNKLKAISEIRETKDGIALKLNDKLKALETLGRYWGLFTDRVETNITTSQKFDDMISQLGGKGLEE